MFETRPIHATDLDLICEHRAKMFLESGKSAEIVSAMAQPFKAWLAKHLAAGTYFGFVIETANGPVGSIGLMSIDWPPHPEHPEEPYRGYVLNLYVNESHRQQGLASRLMELSEREFTRRNISYLILHPTLKAKALYQKLGWSTSGEMIKKCPKV